jgi:hypothetical protein
MGQVVAVSLGESERDAVALDGSTSLACAHPYNRRCYVAGLHSIGTVSV